MGAYECFMQTAFGRGGGGGGGGGLGHVTKILQAENGQKETSLKRYISIYTDIDEKWFVSFEYAITHLSFNYVRLPQLENCFTCFASSVLLFFFFFFYHYQLFNR